MDNQDTGDKTSDEKQSFRENVVKLENYLFKHKKKPHGAASALSSSVGVAIGLKPSGVFDMNYDEFNSCDRDELINAFENLGLKIVTTMRAIKDINEPEWFFDLFIARDFEIARELKQAFESLRDSMDELGQITDREAWEVVTRKIGHLLGYPETAIDEFAKDNREDLFSEERAERMKQYRYFAHSKEHAEEEYEAYDLVLNRALDENAPRTTEILKTRTTAKWI